jgi:hypothetical protein
MAMFRRSRLAAVAVVLGLLAVACSGSGDDGRPTSAPSPDDLAAEVGSFDLAVGPPSRFLVGVFSNDQRFLVYGDVQFRFAYLGTKQDSAAAEYGSAVRARYIPVPGSTMPSPVPAKPQLVSGLEGRGVYATEAGFPRAGFYQVEVTADVEGTTRQTTAAFAVNERHAVPAPGDQALPTENLTLSSTDAPRGAIDSRAATGNGEIPDPSLHQTTIASALAAKRPAVVVFSTPVYCQSRFCGPITEMVEQLAPAYANRATFVHVEIWRDHQNQTINRAAADWLLRDGDLNEPWVFVIGADGKITARFDNVATADELTPLLDKLPVL